MRFSPRPMTSEEVQHTMFQLPGSLVSQEMEEGVWKDITPTGLSMVVYPDLILAQQLQLVDPNKVPENSGRECNKQAIPFADWFFYPFSFSEVVAYFNNIFSFNKP
jgi:hypothetical protein